LVAACCLALPIACVRNPSFSQATPNAGPNPFPRATPDLFERNKLFENSYALVIGVGRYAKPRWKPLKNAVKDAQSISFLLAQQGFYVRYLGDEQATKAEIANTLRASQKQIHPGDRIVIFFAGHGYTQGPPGSETGYIVPYDGDGPDTLISMDEIYQLSAEIKDAQHILWIMDACYSGLMITRGSDPDPRAPDYNDQLVRRRARQIITAGSKDQEVTDTGPDGHSYFTGALLKGLQLGRADLDRDSHVTYSELVGYLQTCGRNPFQTPGNGTMPGHQGGDFVFRANLRQPTANDLKDCSALPKGTSACDRNGDGAVDRIDAAIATGQALGVIPCASSTLKDGSCNVVDVQRVINASLGQACRVD
jgi:uncharacterized caspase-like protein